MPDEYEEGVEPQAEEQVAEVEVQEEVVPEQKIPYARFQEVNEAKNRAEAYAQQLQLMVLQAQQQAQAQRQPRIQEPAPDPDVEALMVPVLRKHLAPYEQEIQRLQQSNIALASKAEAEMAVEYVRRNAPDIDDLMPDINAWVSAQSQVMQNKIKQDPDGVIMVANLVRAERAAGIKSGARAAQQSIKSRTRTNSGPGSANPTSNEPVNWEGMDSKTFNETLKKMGISI